MSPVDRMFRMILKSFNPQKTVKRLLEEAEIVRKYDSIQKIKRSEDRKWIRQNS